MRTLALADHLRQNGCRVAFVCRELPGNICNVLDAKGYDICRLPAPSVSASLTSDGSSYAAWLGVAWDTDAFETGVFLERTGTRIDWIVIDHYGLDFQWEGIVHTHSARLMVIDDLANRPHDCDVLLDQNQHIGMGTRYDGLVPEKCVKLLGPAYALLRSDFIEERNRVNRKKGEIRRILIFFGGSDQTNETEKALEAVRSLNAGNISVDVVVGSSNPQKERIRDICSTMPHVSYHCQVDNMARIMADADLSIGAGGTATWERCCLGLPSVVISVADNQEDIALSAHAIGAIRYLGKHSSVTADDILSSLNDLIKAPQTVATMSAAAAKLVDGRGTARVAAVLMTT
jgi:UDP-2,4-diacetamido-2,4,6-trideoxy-beta-L-altropyranose hydrolase